MCASCSIKEDRTPCPCWLDIDISLCGRRANDVSLRGWNSQKSLFGDILAVAEWPDGWVVEVPKGLVQYTAYAGLDQCALSGSTLVIPHGHEFDRIWAYNADVYCEGETAEDRVVLHKQFATVTVKVREEPDGILSARVTGTSAGFSLTDLSPARGDFDVTVGMTSDGCFIFNLPRQFDDWASMEILRDGVPVRTLDIGDKIAATGYDWTAEDLDDIYIGLDMTKADIEIRIESWQKGAVYDTAPVRVTFADEDFVETKSSFAWSDSEIRDIQMVVTEDDGSLYDVVYSHSGSGLSFRGIIGHHYNVWVGANLGGMVDVRSLEDFKAPRGVSASGIASSGVPMFSGGDDGITISAGQNHMAITLTRMLARVDFRIDKSHLATPSGLVVQDVRIRNAVNSFTPFSNAVRAQDGVTSDLDHSSATDLQTLSGGGTISLYAFENMQGTLLPGNNDPWAKVPSSLGGTADRCSWLEVSCSYESGGRSSDNIVYRMYLGANSTTNFDVRRNHVYTLTLIPTEAEIYGQRGSWKVESGPWTDRRPVSLAFAETYKEIYVNGPNAGANGVWTPGLVVTYADGTSAAVSGTLTSSDSSVASVSGMAVTGRSVGSTTLNATYSEYGITVSTQVPATVDVTDPLIDLVLSPSQLSMTKGTSHTDWTLTAIYPSGDREIAWDRAAYSAGNPVWEISQSTTHAEQQGPGQGGRPGGQGGGQGGGSQVADFSLTTRTQGQFNWSTFSYNYTYEVKVSASASAGADAAGTLTATYTEGGVTKSAQSTLSATDASITGYGFSLSDSSISMEEGDIEVIRSYLTTYYSNGTSVRSDAKSIWTTRYGSTMIVGNAYEGEVLNTGKSAAMVRFIARSTGTTAITAVYTDPDGVEHTASCNVTVGNAQPEYGYEEEKVLVISPDSKTIEEGGSAQFTATFTIITYVLRDGERTGPGQTASSDVTALATWAIDSGAQYVTNDGAGAFSWLSGPGTATIRASYDGATDTAQVTTVAHGGLVSYELESSLEVSPGSRTVAEGGTVQFAATLTTITYELLDGVRTGYSQSSQSDVTSQATWSIDSGAQYVSNDGAGAFSWISGPGSATIRASYSGLSDTAVVTTASHQSAVTYEEEHSLELSPESTSLAEDASVQFTATLITSTYELLDGVRTGSVQTTSTNVTAQARWTVTSGAQYVSNDGAGAFSWLSGPGQSTVKASYGGAEATATIATGEASPGPGPGPGPDPVLLDHIVVSPESVTLRYANGWNDTYTVTAYYTDGSTADVTLLATADNPACALAETGAVRARAAGSGTVTLSYTDGGITKTAGLGVTSIDELYTIGIQAEATGGQAGSAICYVRNIEVVKESHFDLGSTNFTLAAGQYTYTAGDGLDITQESNGDMEIYVRQGTYPLTLSYLCPVSGETVSMTITFTRGTGHGSVIIEYQ